MKRGEDALRLERRQAKLSKGKEALTRGDRGEALKLFRQAVSITHEDAIEAMKRCRDLRVDCIVAPFESDSQLTFL